MKDKVLFAKTGIAKFMVLLVTLLTMFGSCNFVGGSDARTIVDSVWPTDKKKGSFNGVFKSTNIEGPLDVQIWEKGDTFSFAAPVIYPIAPSDWWGGNINVTSGSYDVSEIVSVKFDIIANQNGSLYVNVFQKEDSGANPEYKKDIILKQNRSQSVTISDFPAVTDPVKILFAFGAGEGNFKGGSVKICNFAFYDDKGNEVVPKYAPPLPLMIGDTVYRVDTWFADDNWNEIPNAAVVEGTINKEIKVTVLKANGKQQWQGQVKLDSDIPVVANKEYNITVVVNSKKGINDVTLKACLVGLDNDAVFETKGGNNVVANSDEFIKISSKSVEQSGKLKIVLDFPGCVEDDVITIKSLTFEEG